nr:putative reverse transcriptase domain-containing protein [Tanacetum cinerariifolium]
MRQRRWLELLKDYNTNIQYLHGKANVVADALSRKSGILANLQIEPEIIRDLECIDIELCIREAHSFPFSIHLGFTIMYEDLKQHLWWNGMKQDIGTFVGKCLTCQPVKIEHQRASGLLQPLDILVWKWDDISMDFVTGLPRTPKKNDAICVVVDRLTKAPICWNEVSERVIEGSELIEMTNEKVTVAKKKLKEARS